MDEVRSPARLTGLTKTLCVVVLALMLASMVYVAVTAAHYYGQIGV